MTLREVFEKAAESAMQTGINRDGNFYEGNPFEGPIDQPPMEGPACVLGHLGRGCLGDEELFGVAHVRSNEYLFRSGILLSVPQWNDHHASDEDVVLMFKTLAAEADQ